MSKIRLDDALLWNNICPGRTCWKRGESFTDVKERYYNNKVAKIRKKLASLSTTVDKEDLLGCLDGYCRKLWTERGFMN